MGLNVLQYGLCNFLVDLADVMTRGQQDYLQPPPPPPPDKRKKTRQVTPYRIFQVSEDR
jgi:hypothetical protein